MTMNRNDKQRKTSGTFYNRQDGVDICWVLLYMEYGKLNKNRCKKSAVFLVCKSRPIFVSVGKSFGGTQALFILQKC